MTGQGHNGGPPLEDEHVPEWGQGGVGTYFAWKAAHRAARRTVPWEIMLRRQRNAERVGLTYEEYSLELLERGRYLGPSDEARVSAIKASRSGPTLLEGSRPTRPRVRPTELGGGMRDGSRGQMSGRRRPHS